MTETPVTGNSHMTETNTHNSNAERDALIQEIHAAFADVTLDEGCSWAQTVSHDNWEYDEESLAKARKLDKDTKWTQLVDDPKWHPFPGIGGFNFIDPIGFRYYLPPTLVRTLHDNPEWYPGHLLSIIDHNFGECPDLFNARQMACIARFIAHMASLPNPEYEFDPTNVWADAITSFWWRHLSDNHREKSS